MRKRITYANRSISASKDMQTEYSTAISLAQLNGLHRFLRLRHCHFCHANHRPLRFENDHHNNKLLLSGNPKKRPNFEVSPLTRFHWAPLGANHIREHRELAISDLGV